MATSNPPRPPAARQAANTESPARPNNNHPQGARQPNAPAAAPQQQRPAARQATATGGNGAAPAASRAPAQAAQAARPSAAQAPRNPAQGQANAQRQSPPGQRPSPAGPGFSPLPSGTRAPPPEEENEGISLMGQQDSPYENKFEKNAESFREARSLELDAHPRTRGQGRVMQVVDWKREKQSLDLFLKTDKSLWFLAEVVAFILGIRLLLTGLGTKNDSSFNTFLHVMTQPLVGPFERFTQSIPFGNEGQAFETAAALALASVFIALVLLARLVRSLAAK